MNLLVTTLKMGPEVTVLRVSGIISPGAEADALHSVLLDLLRRGERKLILDLSEVERIVPDPAVFIVRSLSAVRQSGGELRFAPRAHLVRLFGKPVLNSVLTFLESKLPFDPTVAAACEHFQGGSGP